MSNITRFGAVSHLRSEANFHVIRYRNGRQIASGQGLAFWFMPINTSIAEVPTDDRELQFIFQNRSRDFQPVTVQGELTYRVTDPEMLAKRVDFSVDVSSGRSIGEPIEQLSTLFTGVVQKYAIRYIASKPVQELVTEGSEFILQAIDEGLQTETVFVDMGLEIVSVRIIELKPNAELEKAMQIPTRERIQQNADEATFARRALAVEKESAIAENELQNRIDLATREEQLIAQEGQNERRRVEEDALAQETQVKANISRVRLSTESETANQRLHAETDAQTRKVLSASIAEAIRVEGLAEAEKVEAIGLAEAKGVKERMSVYEKLPANVVIGLALQELAGKLQTIEHINITPDVLSTNLADLFSAGAQTLQQLGKE